VLLRQAKRNKAFDGSRFIGLAIDGTGGSTLKVVSGQGSEDG
jgi:hypothetical protein